VALDLRAVLLVAGIGDRQLGQLERVARDVELTIRRHAQPEPNPAVPRSAISFSMESVSTVRRPSTYHAASTITRPSSRARDATAAM